jgi:hypothetical protein
MLLLCLYSYSTTAMSMKGLCLLYVEPMCSLAACAASYNCFLPPPSPGVAAGHSNVTNTTVAGDRNVTNTTVAGHLNLTFASGAGHLNLTSTLAAGHLNLTSVVGAGSRQLTSTTAVHEAGGADSASMVKEKIAGGCRRSKLCVWWLIDACCVGVEASLCSASC